MPRSSRIAPILLPLTRSLLCLAVVVMSTVLTCGQNAPLTKEQVIKMSKAGLSDDVIVAQIKAQPGPMKLSTDDLIALKAAGVSDTVIRALLAPPPTVVPAATGAPAPESTTAAANPDDPNSPHDPGVYLYTVDRDGKQKMTFIDQVGAGREKSHGRTMKAELPGARAVVRTADPKPVFYMYFSPSANISEVGSLSSPSQFSLVAVEAKADHRETSISHVGWLHVTIGNDPKKTSLFESQRIRPYMYKVSLNEGMKAGEYAFIATTSMAGTAHGASVVMYDFGLDAR